MTTTCLINSYNYAEFLGEAIDSALKQTAPFDEIIVVDDGSTDGSREWLSRRYAAHPVVRVVTKPNQGQLSCFNEGFAHSHGDLVYFLDADDVYEPNYLERTLAVYAQHPAVDFVACAGRRFGRLNELQLRYPTSRDLGYSILRAACLRDWVGASTSCLSMRRQVLEKILPLPFLADWRTRADDCLVFGASLAGARKYYLAEPLMRLRQHDNNLFRGRAQDDGAVYRRRVAINRLFEYLEGKLHYNIPRLAEFHHREFCTIESPTWRELRQYLKVGRFASLSLWRRAACLGEMLRHLLLRQSGSARTTIEAAESPRAAVDHLFAPTVAYPTRDCERRVA